MVGTGRHISRPLPVVTAPPGAEWPLLLLGRTIQGWPDSLTPEPVFPNTGGLGWGAVQGGALF